MNGKNDIIETTIHLSVVNVVGTFLLSIPLWWAYSYFGQIFKLPNVGFMESVGITFFMLHIVVPVIGSIRIFGGK